MKEVTVKQMAAIKRIAMNVAPLVAKKSKLKGKIQELNDALAEVQTMIDTQQGFVKEVSGGLTTESLIVRDGMKYVPNPFAVEFNEQKRVYVIKEEPALSEEPLECEGNCRDCDTPEDECEYGKQEEPEEEQLVGGTMQEAPADLPVDDEEPQDTKEVEEEVVEEKEEATMPEAEEVKDEEDDFDPFEL